MHDKFFREKSGIVIGTIGAELLIRLYAQIFGIYQKENPFHMSVFQKAIRGGNRGKSFPRAGCHLDQRSRMIGRERGFQFSQGRDLTFSETGCI